MTINEQKIKDLHPILQDLCIQHLQILKAKNIDCRIVEGFRSWAYQSKLYAKGRISKGQKVTNAPPGYSMHNYGLAYDIVPVELLTHPQWAPNSPLWKIVIEEGVKLGLDSLFKRAGWDLPHFELPCILNRKPKECLKIFLRSGLQGVWDQATDYYLALNPNYTPKLPETKKYIDSIKPSHTAPTTQPEPPAPAAPALTTQASVTPPDIDEIFEDVIYSIPKESLSKAVSKLVARVSLFFASLWSLGVTYRILLIASVIFASILLYFFLKKYKNELKLKLKLILKRLKNAN